MNKQATGKKAEKGLQINRLGYNILGVLMREPMSGYEIVSALEKFRPVNISQVYPLLASMEEKGLLTTETIAQTGKPDKKICHLTPLASETLEAWISGPTEEPVVRDDFLSKVYSFWLTGAAEKRALINERIDWLDSEIAFFSNALEALQTHYPEELDDPGKWQFSRDILFRRRLALYREDKLWCLRVLSRVTDTDDENEADT